MTNYTDVLSSFINKIFVSKLSFYFVLIALSIILCKFKTKNYKNILFFVISVIVGYVLANLCSILVCNVAPDAKYLFERSYWDELYVNILELACLILVGALYKHIRIKNIAVICLVIVLGIFLNMFSEYNTVRKNYLFEIKKVIYRIDKINLVYTVLGESAVIPEKYLSYESVKRAQVFTANCIYNWKERYTKNKYINVQYLLYHNYFNHIYNQDYIGAIFKENSFAEKELNTRLALFDDTMETDEELEKNSISFKQMYKKYKGLSLTVDDINAMELEHGNIPVLQKAKAFICFNNFDFDCAMDLYQKYLISYPGDIDSLLHIANIYKINQKYNEAEMIYKKLTEYDRNNVLFNYNLLLLYYIQDDFEKAIEVNKQIIGINPNVYIPYKNMVILQSLYGDMEKAEEYVNKAKKINVNLTVDWLEKNNLKNLKKENSILEYPSF